MGAEEHLSGQGEPGDPAACPFPQSSIRLLLQTAGDRAGFALEFFRVSVPMTTIRLGATS